MSSRKMARITNVISDVTDGEGGEWYSKIVIECTKPCRYTATKSDHRVFVRCAETIVNMPEGILEIYDGLLRKVGIWQADRETAEIEIVLEHPAKFHPAAFEGNPFRLEVVFNRSLIIDLFNDKKIMIDPGHGGKDAGGRGPVNLLEKKVVVPVAKNLEKVLRRAGAGVVLTRNGDENIPREKRFKMARQEGTDVYISIHTYSHANSAVGGAATLYAPMNGRSARLAQYVQNGLIKKLKVKDRGIREQPELIALSNVPAIEVEVVTITNWVEEGLLRSPTVHRKAAEGIFNGLVKYFALTGRNIKGGPIDSGQNSNQNTHCHGKGRYSGRGKEVYR